MDSPARASDSEPSGGSSEQTSASGPHKQRDSAVSGRVIVRGAVFSGLGMMMSMAGQIGAAMIYTRVLPDADVGVFTLLLVIGDMAIVLANFGLWTAIPKLIVSSPGDAQPRLVNTIMGFQHITCAGIGTGILLLWSVIRDPQVLSTNPCWIAVFPFLWVLPIYVLAGNTRENAAATLAGVNRYGLRAAGLAVGALLNAALVAVFIWWFQTGLVGLILVTLAAHCAAAIGLYASFPFDRRPRFHGPTYRAAVGFSWPLYVNTCLTFLFQRMDTFIVAMFLGTASAAYFEYGAKRLAAYGSLALQSALVPFLPNISALLVRGSRPEAVRLLDRASNSTTLLCYVGVLVGLIIQERLIVLLFTPSYLNGLPAFAPVLLATCLALQAGIMGQSLIALGRPHVVTVINVFTAALSAGLNLALVPRFGLAGAGWAAAAAMAFTNAAQTWCVRRSGLHVNLRRHVQTHVFMLAALACIEFGQTIPWRLAALLLFVTLSLAAGTVTISDARKAIAALLPHRPHT